MKRISGTCAALAILALAACGSSPGPAPAAATASTPASAPAASSAAPALGPMTPGRFPSTTDGRLAAAICRAWSGLRQQYAALQDSDSPAQLNQWFSGPDWSTVQADAARLGNDPAYGHLETALGVAMTGDEASMATARSVDRACETAS